VELADPRGCGFHAPKSVFLHERSADPWPSQLPPRPLTVAGLDLGVFARARTEVRAPSTTFTSPSRRLSRAGSSRTRTLMGFTQGVPCIDITAFVHSQRPEGCLRSAIATGRSCSVLVVSHHLDGLLRTLLAGLLHPAANLGVRCVSALARPGRSEDLPPGGAHPRRAFHTPRRIPLASSRTASPRPLPS